MLPTSPFSRNSLRMIDWVIPRSMPLRKLPATIAIVLGLRRSPSVPISGIGRPPARSSGEVNCKEISAVDRTAANTPTTCSGRYGRRDPPSINTPGAADLLKCNNQLRGPQRLATGFAALATRTSFFETTVPRVLILNGLQSFGRRYDRVLKILRRNCLNSGNCPLKYCGRPKSTAAGRYLTAAGRYFWAKDTGLAATKKTEEFTFR